MIQFLMRHSLRAVSAILGLLAATACAVAALDADSLRDFSSQTAVSGRPGVTYEKRYVLLQDTRNLYRLEYEANTGDPVTLAPEKSIEGTRYTYNSYRSLPKSEKYTGGYPPLGLQPAGNWDDFGFCNLLVNDVGFTYVKPTVSTLQLPQQVGVELVWENSQAIVTQQFVVRENDDKILMKLQVTPQPGKTITSLVLRLKNVPKMGNTVYSNPATRLNAISTPAGETTASARTNLTPATQYWVTYYNKNLGISPSALLFQSSEVTAGHVLVGTDEIHTVLQLSPACQTFHFALWEMPKMPNAQLTQYLQQAGATLATELTTLAGQANWFQALPAVPAQATLHLSSAVRTPTPAETNQGYLVGKLDTFEYADANTLPVEAMPTFSLWGSPGQAVHGSFALYGLSDLSNVTLNPTSLTSVTSGSISIASSQCDLRVTKVWLQRDYQHGNPGGGAYLKCPELLVKNDQLSLPEVNPDGGTGTPGLITGPVLLDLKRDQAKQCVLMIEVPVSATPGMYTGSVEVTTPLGQSSIPISLEVLPINLCSIDDRYDIGIYYRGKSTAAYPSQTLNTAEWVTPTRYAQDLQALRKIGFNNLTVFMPSAGFNQTYLDTIFPTINSSGYKGPLPIANWGYAYNTNFNDATNAAHRQTVSNFLSYSLNNGYPLPTFYGIDEPAGTELDTCRQRANITHEVVVNGVQGTYMVAGSTNGSLVDVLDYPVMSAYFNTRAQMQTLRDQFLANGATPYYYWQIWGEYPKGTRLNSGYFLYASGYKGVQPYAYQHYWDNAYDEYDSTEKDMMTMYPSVDGPVATLQSEGMRAGLADLRYLVTLEALLDEVDRKLGAGQSAAMRTTLSNLLTKYGYTSSQYWGRMIYGALTWPEHQTTVQNNQFDLDRRQVADLIVQCANLLEPPTVTLTAPTAGNQLVVESTYTLTATAADTDGSIVKVEFYDGDVKLGEDTSAPYECVWSSPTPDTHTITVVATDDSGLNAMAAAMVTVWRTQYIGTSADTGFASYSASTSTFTIDAASNLNANGNTDDDFRFVYRPVSGNCTIIARVTGVSGANGNSLAGVMIRETVGDTTSKHVCMAIKKTNGAHMVWRTNTGGGSSRSTNYTGVLPPYWVKLVRDGNTFTGYYSSDGVTWTTARSVTVAMGADVYWGLASENYFYAANADTFTDVSMTCP